jgi:hypothetical protein
MITVLCADSKSNYYYIPDLDIYDQVRDAYTFRGSNPVITHAPCQQWSRLKAFSKPNHKEKELAWFCYNTVMRNGGIFEHPYGSSFWEHVSKKNVYSVDQFWWGFPARKRTLLLFSKCKPISYPVRFDAVEKKVEDMDSRGSRSRMTLDFAQWLVDCVGTSKTLERG